MNTLEIIQKLKKLYPDKQILKIPEENPTEIICEIDPSNLHPEYSDAIAIINQSLPHVHAMSTETYEVLEGTLILTINNTQQVLQRGDRCTVKPHETHSASGNNTWVLVKPEPGWTLEDHVLIN